MLYTLIQHQLQIIYFYVNLINIDINWYTLLWIGRGSDRGPIATLMPRVMPRDINQSLLSNCFFTLGDDYNKKKIARYIPTIPNYTNIYTEYNKIDTRTYKLYTRYTQDIYKIVGGGWQARPGRPGPGPSLCHSTCYHIHMKCNSSIINSIKFN